VGNSADRGADCISSNPPSIVKFPFTLSFINNALVLNEMKT
jgi:hypothetical protein